MPFYILAYSLIFFTFSIANMGYMLYMKCKLPIVLYELAFAVTVFLFIFASYSELLLANLTALHAMLFFCMLGYEVYSSIYLGPENFGIELDEEIDEMWIEAGRVCSILFAAPAYVLGALLAYRLLLSGAGAFLKG